MNDKVFEPSSGYLTKIRLQTSLILLFIYLGCAPLEDFEVRPAEGWNGGFFCPCHGSKFDLAGRVYKGVPAPTNLCVPPHRFVNDELILIGQDTGAA